MAKSPGPGSVATRVGAQKCALNGCGIVPVFSDRQITGFGFMWKLLHQRAELDQAPRRPQRLMGPGCGVPGAVRTEIGVMMTWLGDQCVLLQGREPPRDPSRWAPGGFLRLRRAASRIVEEEDPRNSQRSRSVLQRKASLAAPLATGCHCVPHSPSLKIRIIFNFSFSFPIDKLSIAKAYLYFIFSWHRTKRSTILASIPVDFPYPDGERLLGNSLLHLSV